MELLPFSVTQSSVIAEPKTYKGNEVYYDGTEKLNAMVVECTKLDNLPSQCYANKFCGYCGTKCVPGTPKGPIAPCKGIFNFNAPNSPLNVFNSGDINLYAELPRAGLNKQPALIKTYTPDMKRVYVDNAYM